MDDWGDWETPNYNASDNEEWPDFDSAPQISLPPDAVSRPVSLIKHDTVLLGPPLPQTDSLLMSLPCEVLLLVLKECDWREHLRVSVVCKEWKQMCDSPELWKFSMCCVFGGEVAEIATENNLASKTCFKALLKTQISLSNTHYLDHASAAQFWSNHHSKERGFSNEEVVLLVGNDTCLHCATKNPLWTTPKFGNAFCLNCASQYRCIGTHVTGRIVHALMDRIRESDILLFWVGGNDFVGDFFKKITGCHPRESNMSIKSQLELLEAHSFFKTLQQTANARMFVAVLKQEVPTWIVFFSRNFLRGLDVLGLACLRISCSWIPDSSHQLVFVPSPREFTLVSLAQTPADLWVFDYNQGGNNKPIKISGAITIKFLQCSPNSFVAGGTTWKQDSIWGVSGQDSKWSYQTSLPNVPEIGDRRYFNGALTSGRLFLFQRHLNHSNTMLIRQFNPEDGKEDASAAITWKNPVSFGNFLESPYIFPSRNGKFLLTTVDDCYAPLKRGPYHCDMDFMVWTLGSESPQPNLFLNISRTGGQFGYIGAISDSGRWLALHNSGLLVYYINDDKKIIRAFANLFCDVSSLEFMTLENDGAQTELLLLVQKTAVTLYQMVIENGQPSTKTLWVHQAEVCPGTPSRLNSFYLGKFLGLSHIAVGSISCADAPLPRTDNTTNFRILDLTTGNTVWIEQDDTPKGISGLRIQESGSVFLTTVSYTSQEQKMLRMYTVSRCD